MPKWEYCVLTRLSAGVDTKWFANRVFRHSQTEMPEEVTERRFAEYNQKFEALHRSQEYPILPAVLNLMGGDGWELIDDMRMGLTGGEGLVFKRPEPAVPAIRKKKLAAKKKAARKR